MNVNGGPLDFVAALDNSQFGAAMREMRNDVSRLTGDLQTQGAQIESFASKAAAAAAGFFSTQAAAGFVKQMVQVRGEFQQIEIAFNTMLGSKEKADQLMAEAVKLAAITPFTLNDVAKGAKQLLAYGFAAGDITQELTKLGNVAAGVGSQLGDIVYLYGTMKAGGRVTQVDLNQFAGRGIPIYDELAKVIGKTTGEVRAYVSAGKIGFPEVEKAFGNMTGQGGKFFNLMQEQSKSLTGQLANLGDAWDMMLNSLGKSQEGIIGDGIQAAIELVENYQKVIDIIGILIISYGVYRASLIVTAVNQRIVAEGQLQMALSGNTLAASQLRAVGATTFLNQALVRIRTTLMSFAAATAPIAVITAFIAVGYALVQYQDAAEIAENSLTEAKEKGARALDNETEKINGLLKTIKDHNVSKREQKAAYDELLQTTQGALDKYSQEEIAAGKGAEAIDKYKESVRKATETNQQFADYKGLQEQIDAINEKGIKALNTFDRLAISIKRTFAPTSQGMSMGQWWDELISGKAAKKGIIDSQLKELKGAQDLLLKGNPDVAKLVNTKTTAEPPKTTPPVTPPKTPEELAKEAAAAKKYNALLEKRKDLEREISQDLAGARASALSEEDKQVAAINAKYDDRLAQLDKINAKLNPEDQSKAKVQVESARNVELGVNGIDTIINGKGGYKEELERKKQLFEEYEQARVDFGETKARELYRNEIGAYKNFLDYLNNDINSRKGDNTLLATKKNQVAAPMVIESQEEARKRYNGLLKEFMSYNDQRQAAIERYQADTALLEEKGVDTSTRITKYKEEIDALNDQIVRSLPEFKALFDGIDQLSDDNANNIVDAVKAKLATTNMSKELRSEIEKLLKNTSLAIADRMPDRIINLANSIDQVTSAVSEVDETFGKLLSTVGNVVGQVGNIKKGMIDLKASQGSGDTLGQLSAGLGIFGAGVSIFSSITKLFDNSAKREEQAAYSRDLQNKQTEAINKALERQVALINDAYGTDRLVKYREAQEQIRKDEELYQKQLANRYALTGNKVLDDAITRYNTTGNKDYLGVVKNLGDLDKFKLPSGLADLERLADEGKLDEGTSKIVENLINAEKAAKDLANQLKADTIGSSLDSIADDFIGALTDGTQDFGKTFEDTIRTSILNGFKGELIKNQLQRFYDDYAIAAQDGNLTTEEIAALRKTYIDASEKSKKDLENLEKLTGIDLTGKPEESNKSTGGLKSSGITASQESVDVNNAIARSNYEQLKSIGLTALDHLQVARQGIDSLRNIEQHTFNTVNELKASNESLKAIVTNTKPAPKSQGWQAVGG